MSEEHIKTVVLDTPPARLAEDEKSEERRVDEAPNAADSAADGHAAPPGSWLS